MSNTKKLARVSIKACFTLARSLLKNGWIQESSRLDKKTGKLLDYCEKSSGRCSYCAAGAIERALFNLGDKEVRREHEMKQKLMKVNNITEFCVEEWNDKSGRTKTEVLQAFDKVIRSVS